MLGLLKTVFVPNRIDRVVWSILLTCIGIVAVYVFQENITDKFYPTFPSELLILSWGAFIGGLLGLSAIVGSRGHGRSQRWVALIGIGFCLAFYVWFMRVGNSWQLTSFPMRGSLKELAVLGRNDFLVSGCLAGVAFLSITGMMIGGRLKNLKTKFTFGSKKIRLRLLIGVGIVLAATTVLRNIGDSGTSLAPVVNRFLFDWNYDGKGATFHIFGAVVFALTISVLPVLWLQCSYSAWFKSVVWAGYFFVLTAVATAISNFFLSLDFQWSVFLVSYACVFSGIQLANRPGKAFGKNYLCDKSEDESGERQSDSASAKPLIGNSLPMHWSILAIAVLICVSVFHNRYDGIVLLNDWIVPDWTTARMSRELAIVENATIHFNRGGHFVVKCETGVADDVFRPMAGYTSPIRLSVENCQTNIDFSYLPPSGAMNFNGGKMTIDQLIELDQRASRLIFSDVELVDSDVGGGKHVMTSPMFAFWTDSVEDLKLLTKRFDLSKTLARTSLSGEFSVDDVANLVVLPKRGSLWVRTNAFADESDWTHFDKKVQPVIELACQSTATFQLNSRRKQKWPILYFSMLAQGGPTGITETMLPDSLPEDGVDLSRELEFLFYGDMDTGNVRPGESSGKRLEKVFFPSVRGDDLARLANEKPDLKVLSLDYRWIGLDPTLAYGVSEFDSKLIANEVLPRFKNLEELYLPEGFHQSSFDFLAGFSKLKKLQVELKNRSQSAGKGLSKCQALEEITVFGFPDKVFFDELKMLPNLKKVVIVHPSPLNYFGSVPGSQRTYQSALPNITVNYFDGRVYVPNVPQDFLDHRDRLRKQYLDGYRPWQKMLDAESEKTEKSPGE